ncbi:unnamed protein product [Brassica oleracea var. botrytis]
MLSLDESESSDVKLKKARAAVSTYREANESCCRQLKIEGDALECFSGTEKEIVKMIKTVMMMNGRSGSAQCLPPDSRVFIDNEVSRPIQYLSWLAVHPNASELVNTSKTTKIETLTIGVIVTFVNNESVQLTMSKEIPGGSVLRYLCTTVVTKPASCSFEMQALNVPEDKLLTYSTISWEANGELVGEEEVPTPHCLVDASGYYPMKFYIQKADHHSHHICLSCAPSSSENNSGQPKLGARCGPPPLSSQFKKLGRFSGEANSSTKERERKAEKEEKCPRRST